MDPFYSFWEAYHTYHNIMSVIRMHLGQSNETEDTMGEEDIMGQERGRGEMKRNGGGEI